MQHPVHALAGSQELRQAHHVTADDPRPRILAKMGDHAFRPEGEVVEHDHLAGTLAEQQVGGRGADQAGATDNQEAAPSIGMAVLS